MLDQHGLRQNSDVDRLLQFCTLNTQQLDRCGRERHSRLEPAAELAYLVTALTFV